MSVYSDFFYYVGGVYQHVTGPLFGPQCVTVVGYDDVHRYWICKNCWGTAWGTGWGEREGRRSENVLDEGIWESRSLIASLLGMTSRA